MPTLEEAIGHIRMGNREHGRQILEEILENEETNEDVWLWLSAAVDSNEDREICLENVLALNPDNIIAQRGLGALQSGTFNANDLLADILELDEEEAEEEEKQEATFLDDFVRADDEDEELELPSSMKESKPRRAKKSGRGGLNVRMVILAVLIVGVMLVLGAVAAFSLFGGNNGTATDQPTDTPVIQEQEQPAEPTATDTPEPTVTATSTPTPRPRLTLPVATLTREPSPTATRVVSPTPSR